MYLTISLINLIVSYVMQAILSIVKITLFTIFNRSYKNRTGKMRTFFEAARPLVSFFLFMILFLYWAHMSPNNILESDPRILYLLCGTVFSNLSVRPFTI